LRIYYNPLNPPFLRGNTFRPTTQTSWRLQITCLRLPVLCDSTQTGAARTGRQAQNNKQAPNSNKRNPRRVVLIVEICPVLARSALRTGQGILSACACLPACVLRTDRQVARTQVI